MERNTGVSRKLQRFLHSKTILILPAGWMLKIRSLSTATISCSPETKMERPASTSVEIHWDYSQRKPANMFLPNLKIGRSGVEGHWMARHPWLPYHEFLTEPMARIVGAKPEEVVVMNTLTVNLHLMMITFYRPTSKRHKIIIEAARSIGSIRRRFAGATSQFCPPESVVELNLAMARKHCAQKTSLRPSLEKATHLLSFCWETSII